MEVLENWCRVQAVVGGLRSRTACAEVRRGEHRSGIAGWSRAPGQSEGGTAAGPTPPRHDWEVMGDEPVRPDAGGLCPECGGPIPGGEG